jgi:hypothetical protein
VQALELLQQGVAANGFNVVYGAATERREAGSEYHAGIKQVLVGNDLFPEAADRLVQ